MESSSYVSDTGIIKSDTITSVAQQIIDKDSPATGSVVVRGIPVTFNLVNGDAKTEKVEVSPGLHNQFDGFTDVVPLVQRAISLVVKSELLEQLLALNDQTVTKRIHANHSDPKKPGEFSNLTLEQVDLTLRQIAYGPSVGMRLFSPAAPSPLQEKLSKALVDIDGITNRVQVKVIMQQLSPQPKQQPKPPTPQSGG